MRRLAALAFVTMSGCAGASTTPIVRTVSLGPPDPGGPIATLRLSRSQACIGGGGLARSSDGTVLSPGHYVVSVIVSHAGIERSVDAPFEIVPCAFY
jgi:hypothetical protein